jgi:hypothetical protein
MQTRNRGRMVPLPSWFRLLAIRSWHQYSTGLCLCCLYFILFERDPSSRLGTVEKLSSWFAAVFNKFWSFGHIKLIFWLTGVNSTVVVHSIALLLQLLCLDCIPCLPENCHWTQCLPYPDMGLVTAPGIGLITDPN